MSAIAVAVAALLSLGSYSSGSPPHAMLGNVTYRADIATPADQDYFQAVLMAGERVRTRVARAKGSQLLPTIQLENPGGQSLGIRLSTSSGRNAGQVAKFPWRIVPTSGRYNVVVAGTSNTSGAYDAQLDVRQAVTKKSGKGLLDATTPQTTVTFEGAAGARLSFKVKWGSRDTALEFVSLLDPDGVAVPGAGQNLSTSSRKIEFKNLDLKGRLGTYTLLLRQEGATTGGSAGKVAAKTKFNYVASVKSPERKRLKKPITLATAEPTLDPVTDPIDATAGSNVTVTGDNFSADDGVQVFVGETEVTVCCATESTIEFTVPDDSTVTVGSIDDVTVVNSDSQAVTETNYVALQDADNTPPPPPPPPPPTTTPPPTTPPPPTTTQPPVAFSWTALTQSSDSRVVYVSSASGSDSNNGLSAQAPVRTLQKGYALLRDGYPDWMLLKKGDTWTGERMTIKKSGRGANEPLVLAAYGSGSTRPKILDGRIRTEFQYTVNHIAIVGLHLERTSETSGAPGTGLELFHNGNGLLVEDCFVRGYAVNMVIQGKGGQISNAKVRGCVSVDAYSTGGHAQGLFAFNVNGLTIESSVFDHNGWRQGVSGASPTIFNHNIYVQKNCSNVTVRNIISTNASSHGLQLRPGGVCEDSLFLDNGISILMGHAGNDWPTQKATGTIRRNVIMGGRDISSSPRGMAIWLERASGVDIDENVIANQVAGTQPVAIYLGMEYENLLIRRNVVCDWTSTTATASGIKVGGSPAGANVIRDNVLDQSSGRVVFENGNYSKNLFSYSGNRYRAVADGSAWFQLPGQQVDYDAWTSYHNESNPAEGTSNAFPYRNRTIATYQSSIGGTASVQAFLAEARRQSKDYWRDEFTAGAVNSYIRQGFGVQDD